MKLATIEMTTIISSHKNAPGQENDWIKGERRKPLPTTLLKMVPKGIENSRPMVQLIKPIMIPSVITIW
jgi:hypothetical protein